MLIFRKLIGVEGTKTPAGVAGMGDPTGAKAPRRLPTSPAESEVPGAEINIERTTISLLFFYGRFEPSQWIHTIIEMEKL